MVILKIFPLFYLFNVAWYSTVLSHENYQVSACWIHCLLLGLAKATIYII